jgi:hypothetical protein
MKTLTVITFILISALIANAEQETHPVSFGKEVVKALLTSNTTNSSLNVTEEAVLKY